MAVCKDLTKLTLHVLGGRDLVHTLGLHKQIIQAPLALRELHRLSPVRVEHTLQAQDLTP